MANKYLRFFNIQLTINVLNVNKEKMKCGVSGIKRLSYIYWENDSIN
jgi:hypothetical protein